VRWLLVLAWLATSFPQTRVKWLISIGGTTYGRPNVKRGEVDDLPEAEAQRMINAGMAQPNWRDDPAPPFQQQSATVKTRGLREVWDGWRA
jgi:hypothetical protein